MSHPSSQLEEEKLLDVHIWRGSGDAVIAGRHDGAAAALGVPGRADIGEIQIVGVATAFQIIDTVEHVLAGTGVAGVGGRHHEPPGRPVFQTTAVDRRRRAGAVAACTVMCSVG